MNRDHFWLSDDQFEPIVPHLPHDTRGKPRIARRLRRCSRESRTSPRPSVTRYGAGTPSFSSSMTVASPSTTTSPSAPSGR